MSRAVAPEPTTAPGEPPALTGSVTRTGTGDMLICVSRADGGRLVLDLPTAAPS
jgi:hypothetical protein